MKDDLRQALSLHQSGAAAEAESICRGHVAEHPRDPDAAYLLGTFLLDGGRFDEAIDLLRRALRNRPSFPQAYNNLGAALEARFQLQKAENAYRAALRIDPVHIGAWGNLGNVLRKQGRPAAAMESYRAAIQCDPHATDAMHGLAVALGDLGDLSEALELHRRLVDLSPESAPLHSDFLQVLQHDALQTSESLFAEAQRYAQRHAEHHRASWQRHENVPSPQRRLRVGYVSPDFRDHPVGRTLHPVLANHDRSSYEVFCYADFRAPPDDMTAIFAPLADAWRDTTRLSEDALAELIRADQIDLLVDCAGHFGGNRLPVFARRPAPVQITAFGYCATTGLDAIDYRLTDPHSDPPELQTQTYYAERLVYLPDCWWCYHPPDAPPPVAPSPAAATGHITFGCLNRLIKVTEPVVELWARILLAVPDSRLLLLAGEATNPHLFARFARHGIAEDRLELTVRVPRPQYLALHHRIDINLDPFPYNGDNTLCDGLLMGVPCVALAGTDFRSRRGVSHLLNLGLPEQIAQTPQEYVDIAVRLAGDLPRLATLRDSLRQRLMSSPLWDSARYVRALEDAYRQMWRRWCERSAADDPEK